MSKEFKAGDFVWAITYEGDSPLTPVFAKIIGEPCNSGFFALLIDSVNIVVSKETLFKTKEKAFTEWKKLASNYIEETEIKLEKVKNNLGVLSHIQKTGDDEI